MENVAFDHLVQTLAGGGSRRSLLKRLASSAIGGTLTMRVASAAPKG